MAWITHTTTFFTIQRLLFSLALNKKERFENLLFVNSKALGISITVFGANTCKMNGKKKKFKQIRLWSDRFLSGRNKMKNWSCFRVRSRKQLVLGNFQGNYTEASGWNVLKTSQSWNKIFRSIEELSSFSFLFSGIDQENSK